MADKIDELVQRLETIEQQLATIMRHLPEPEPVADQTLAGGSVSLAAVDVDLETAGVGHSG
jgi:hypothetical protein